METRINIYRRYFNILVLTVAIFFICNCKPAISQDDLVTNNPDFKYNVLLHDLDVKIDVAKHSIFAKDKIDIELNSHNAKQIAFLLNDNLTVNKITYNSSEKPLEWKKSHAANKIQMVTVQLPINDSNKISVKVEYEGEIYDPVITAQELGHLRGDVTAGLISEEGVYLSNSSYWYPCKLKGLSLFNMTTYITDPYKIVTQGELKSREVKDGISISRWESHIPADGLALVAGKFVVHSKNLGQIAVSTYFFKEDDEMSDLFLEAAKDYLNIYSAVLGPYPYKKFDVVENFFSTGYGMPSYTLLGNYVIKRGQGSLKPGYLDHEIVHSWFGNYVFNDAIKGNWVEALTTYCANYYYKELMMSADDALDHRKNASLKYSIRVSKDEEYAVNGFVTKTKEADNEIGYTKGSMVFHQLRQTIGDELFFKGLRELVKRFGGKYAEWADLQTVFEDVSKKELGWFFKQWVETKGAPELKLENVKLEFVKDGYLVKGEISQNGTVYKLNIPVHINTGTGDNVFYLDLDTSGKKFEYKVSELPVSISIDPEFHLFKRIAPEDVSPCLNALLEDDPDNKFFVYPAKCPDVEKNLYHGLVESAKNRTGGTIVSDEKINPGILKSSIFIAGNAINSESFNEIFDNLPENIQLGTDSFTINGEKYSGPEYSLLCSFRNPLNKLKFVTVYYGLSPQAVSRARYIFFYGWNSYVIFKNGLPVTRGSFENNESETSHNFAKSITESIKSENIMEHIKYLSSKKLAGRYPGTEGDLLARNYIENKFVQYNITPVNIVNDDPFEQSFDIVITDLKEFEIEFQNDKKKI